MTADEASTESGDSHLHRSTTRPVLHKIAIAVSGTAVSALGVALLVLPGPGVVVLTAGLSILALEFEPAARARDAVLTRARRAVSTLRRS